MLWLLLAAVLLKLALLLVYVRRYHGLRGPWFERAHVLVGQFRHSAPFGLSSALYPLRGQADQWVAASLFALSSFAAFSIAAVVGQRGDVFRHSVLEAFLPSMSRMQAAGDVTRHAGDEQPRQRDGRHAALPAARLRVRLRRGDHHPRLHRRLPRGGRR